MQSVGPPRPKEALGNVNDYEILLMLDADLDEERHNEIISRARQLVEQGGGTWVGHDPWGRRKLAYEINKKTDGVYHLIQFDADPATLDELTRILKITDGVMRHLATRRIESPQGPGRPGPEPVLETTRDDRPSEYAAVANTRSQEAPELESVEIESAPSVAVSSDPVSSDPPSSDTEEA
jgi:small subunit ribosomal protein S6